MQGELKVEMGFVQRRLPWWIAAGAMVLYVITLNYSATFAGISSLTKAAGWDWRSNVVAPLHVLLTFPVRWCPASLQLFFLNLLAAASAALALGLLGRAVALLPHDRTREQRALERSDHSMLSIPGAWLPPVLAALLCGLQLTFWENAVVATGEAFDLLLFAWLVTCLLEYRLDEKESRLRWFALVYGLAVVNNYAMVAFFPAFLLALLWIKGATFFRWRFVLGMFLCGLAGLLLYLVLPLVESATDLAGFSFWELLRSYWGHQKFMLLQPATRYVIVICSLTSLVPVLFIGIRWPAQFGEASAAGNALTNLMTHVIHAVFLVACLDVAFDPPFSPRRLTTEAYAMLPLYFLGALAVGYCSGYFLLVFGAKPGPQAWQRPSPLRRVINQAALLLMRVALVAVPAGLLFQNLPVIWASTGQAMSRLSQLVLRSLPPAGAYVMSDDSFRLNALQYELRKSRPDHKYVLVDTSQLVASGYHSYLQKKYPAQWPAFQRPADPKALMDPVTLIELLGQLTQRGQVFYLHPSFGYYFEAFYAQPRGLLYELKGYSDRARVGPPPLTKAEIETEDRFWQSIQATELDPLIRKAPPFRKPSKQRPQPRTLQSYLGELYARAIDEVGVQIQRSGDFVRAARCFDLAAKLNPSNPVAVLNADFNKIYQDKGRVSTNLSLPAKERLEVYGNRWDRILTFNGPVDEPNACLYVAETFQRGRNFRQAAVNLERSLFFEPDNRPVRLNFMLTLVKAQLPEVALQQLAEFRRLNPESNLREDELIDLVTIEAWAHVAKEDVPGADQLLTAAQQRYPKASAPWDALSDIYLTRGDATNALRVLEKQLQVQPESVRALSKYGGLKLSLAQANEAIVYLDRALRLSPKDEPSLLNRALANLTLDRLNEALQDLLTLEGGGRSTYNLQALHLIAETYWRKRDTKGAILYYEKFLAAAPDGLVEGALARERLRLLRNGSAFRN
jgi:tetratricopeptide (TPR) repeat protein